MPASRSRSIYIEDPNVKEKNKKQKSVVAFVIIVPKISMAFIGVCDYLVMTVCMCVAFP